ncbi:MAG: electron transfer flavoprotein subunit alpha/FixB family protein [Anaerolineales bacterium]
MTWHDIWTLAEVKAGKLHEVSFELLTWGRSLADARGCQLCSVVITDQIDEEELAYLFRYGADVIYVLKDPDLNDFLVEPYAKALVHLIERYQPEVFLAAATTTGRTLMPYVAVKVHAGLTADCTGLEIDPETGNLLQTRPAIGGNIMATIKTPTARPQMATVRPKSIRIHAESDRKFGKIINVDSPGSLGTDRMRFEAFIPDATEEVAIEEADVIVSGGYGMQSPANFQWLTRLAEPLNASVGVSRAAVERGWKPYSRQVGLSGKTVAPKLYIACGISGAVQHLAGMQTSQNIIAINLDPHAQIFQVADLGIVGDVFEILPALVYKLEKNHQKVATK